MTVLARLIVTALLMTAPAIASLRDIHPENLPQAPEIQKAYADMITIEELVWSWTPVWRYQTPKADVVALAEASLRSLEKAQDSAPENVELLLLTGLVAHYAYNVDVEKVGSTVVQSLEKAQKLAPGDYRPVWFLGIHQCQGSGPKEGMENLLSIESKFSWDKLPPDFWDDYFSCANLANMPAHGLRAGDHLAKLNVPASKQRDALMEVFRKRFTTPDPAATYSFNNVWLAEKIGSHTLGKNSMFGLALTIPDGSRLGLSDVQQGKCELHIELPSQQGKAGTVLSNIYLVARQPKTGETLDDFVKTFWEKGYAPAKPVKMACPAQECLSIHGINPGLQRAEGDGHVIVTAFKRDAPEFPGLLLETPTAPPAGEAGKMTYSHPDERLRRLEGPLYYLVVIFTATSVLDQAESDYETLLKSMRVE